MTRSAINKAENTYAGLDVSLKDSSARRPTILR